MDKFNYFKEVFMILEMRNVFTCIFGKDTESVTVVVGTNSDYIFLNYTFDCFSQNYVNWKS